MSRHHHKEIETPKNLDEWYRIKDEFFDVGKFGAKIRDKFHLTNVRFMHMSQFGSIFTGFDGKKEKASQEVCEAKGKKRYSLKVYQHDHTTPGLNYIAVAEKEIHFYGLLKRHPHICKFYKHLELSLSGRIDGCYLLKMEFLQMSLHDLFEKGLLTAMSCAQVRRVMQHVGSALNHIQDMGVVHHEINLKNVRVKQINLSDLSNSLLDCDYKVINFVFTEEYDIKKPAKREDALQEESLLQIGSMFLAPEKTASPFVPYNPFLAEVYSFGALLLACVLGPQRCEVDFELREIESIRERILKYQQEDILDGELTNLLLCVLNKDPTERCYMDAMKSYFKSSK